MTVGWGGGGGVLEHLNVKKPWLKPSITAGPFLLWRACYRPFAQNTQLPSLCIHMCVHNCSRVRRLNCTHPLFRLSYAISAKKCLSKCRLGRQRACCASLEAKRVWPEKARSILCIWMWGMQIKALVCVDPRWAHVGRVVLLLLIRIAPEHPFPLQV